MNRPWQRVKLGGEELSLASDQLEVDRHTVASGKTNRADSRADVLAGV